MPSRTDAPSLRQELAALGDIYLTVLWMLKERLYYGRNWQRRVAYVHTGQPGSTPPAVTAAQREPADVAR